MSDQKIKCLIKKLNMTESATNLLPKDQRVKIVEDKGVDLIVEVAKEDLAMVKSIYGALPEMNE